MTSSGTTVLIASGSTAERLNLENALENAGRRVCSVSNAAEAEFVCAGNGGATLVIDDGLLESPRESQWRELRYRHPELAAVVRCAVSRNQIQRTDRNTLRVHASNAEGILDAIDLLDSYRLGTMPGSRTQHASGSDRIGHTREDLSP